MNIWLSKKHSSIPSMSEPEAEIVTPCITPRCSDPLQNSSGRGQGGGRNPSEKSRDSARQGSRGVGPGGSPYTQVSQVFASKGTAFFFFKGEPIKALGTPKELPLLLCLPQCPLPITWVPHIPPGDHSGP